MGRILIKNGQIVNEGKIIRADIVINGKKIESISQDPTGEFIRIIDASEKFIFPGLIDDQVHFREPGLTHKAEIYTEAKAAVAGGITSYMEMPNTIPNTLTQDLLAQKYKRASECSLANYSFFMGVSNENIDEVLKTDPRNVCGIKIFMGSSTGNMLVDNKNVLEEIFAKSPCLIATHCEDEATIKANVEKYKTQTNNDLKPEHHPLIRSAEACYKSSSMAIELAKKHNTRLHILHISSGIETALFENKSPLKSKRITSEACIHHLWFTDEDYKRKGNFIKWNPAVKSATDREEIWKAALDGRIDVIATDHAPHTLEEKQKPYAEAPSGGPLVQHSLLAMLQFYHAGKISLEKIAEKMCHNVADIFSIENRGFIREGYFADLVIVDVNTEQAVTNEGLYYKCGWSPFEGEIMKGKIEMTFVNGHLAYNNGKFNETEFGMRLTFDR